MIILVYFVFILFISILYGAVVFYDLESVAFLFMHYKFLVDNVNEYFSAVLLLYVLTLIIYSFYFFMFYLALTLFLAFVKSISNKTQ